VAQQGPRKGTFLFENTIRRKKHPSSVGISGIGRSSLGSLVKIPWGKNVGMQTNIKTRTGGPWLQTKNPQRERGESPRSSVTKMVKLD